MRFLRAFLIFWATVILFLTAFNFAAGGLWGLPGHPVGAWMTRWLVRPETLARPEVWRLLWALTALLVVLIWLLTIFLWQGRTRALHVTTTSGEELLIHPGALIKFVKLQVESHPAVVSQRVRVRQKTPGGIAVWIMATVQPIDSLVSIKHQIEEMILFGLRQVLGIDRLDELTIIIGLDDKNLQHRPGPAGTPEPKPEPPVRGPLERAVAEPDAEPIPQPEPPVARPGDANENEK